MGRAEPGPCYGPGCDHVSHAARTVYDVVTRQGTCIQDQEDDCPLERVISILGQLPRGESLVITAH